jgi:hypothetical protein
MEESDVGYWWLQQGTSSGFHSGRLMLCHGCGHGISWLMGMVVGCWWLSWKGETSALEGWLVACCVWMVRRWVVRIDVVAERCAFIDESVFSIFSGDLVYPYQC